MAHQQTDDVIHDLRTVYARIQRHVAPTWLKLDLSMAQFKALVAVERQAGVGVCRLGEQLGVGESAASLLVEQLVRRGYVSRQTDPADRRRVALTVTVTGAECLRELRQGSDEILHEWLAALADDDRGALARGLGALAEVVCSPEDAAHDPLCHPAPAPLESRTS
jgi:DNA-binding MarR family transcriptional regulator